MSKKIFRLFMIMAAVMGCAVAMFGGHTEGVLYAVPVVLDTQKMVWLTSLKEEYEKIDTWISEAEDLSSFVSEGQTLVFPEAGASPNVYVNRTTDVDSVEPTETTNEVALDVYDSQNYKIRNIYMHALSFDKIAYYTKKSADAIVKQEIADAAFAYTPTSAGNKKIVVASTGATRGLYKMLTLNDVINLARQCDAAAFPTDDRNLVLPSDMWWDLVVNNDILKGQMERQTQNGVLKPLIVEYYGFKIHKSEQPLGLGYDTSTSQKAAQGTAITGTVVPCGFLFVKESVFRAGGQFLMFNKDLQQNTEGRAYEFGFQHRFKADYQRDGQKYGGLVYLALA